MRRSDNGAPQVAPTQEGGATFPGAFVVFCGIDGSGKTTQLNRLAVELAPRPVLVTREPTDSYRSDPDVRRYLNLEVAGPEAQELLTEMAVFSAFDRLRHLRRAIRPALRAGTHVLCDRYVYSAYAYMAARGVDDLRWLMQLNRHCDKPDLVFYLDVEPELAARRIIARDGSSRKREELHLARMEAVRGQFLAQRWGASQGFSVLDGARGKDDLAMEIAHRVRVVLEARERGPVHQVSVSP